MLSHYLELSTQEMVLGAPSQVFAFVLSSENANLKEKKRKETPNKQTKNSTKTEINQTKQKNPQNPVDGLHRRAAEDV